VYLNHPDNGLNYYAIDIEADSLTPTKIWCVVIKEIYGEEDTWSFRPADIENGYLADFINTLKDKPTTRWVGHNAISYDIPALNALAGTSININDIVDTLTLSYLYDPHMRGGHSLSAWGARFGNQKIEFDDFSHFTEEMLSYCEQDVEITATLFKRLSGRMKLKGFSELSCEIEHKIRKIIDEQTANGVKFDERRATILLAELQSLKANVEKRIHSVFPPKLVLQGEYHYRLRQDGTPYASYKKHLERYSRLTFSNSGKMYRTWDYKDFNIGSPKQRVERLLALGWKPTEFTPKTPKGGGGNPKVTEDQLLAFAKKSGLEEVALISDWMLYSGRIRSLEEWLKHLKDDGRIHGRVFSCGAGTRRMRHTTPNTANICSADKPYGRELRELWTVSEGSLLVGIDAKGLEGRVLMHYLDNPAAEEFLTSDFHTANAIAVYEALGLKEISENLRKWRDAGKPKEDEESNGYRQILKALFYAFLYGASDPKLGKMMGKNRKVGIVVRATLMENVPGLKELTEKVQSEYHSTKEGWIETIDGGFVRCPSPHAALNYLCQSAGGILMKLATILAYGYSINALDGAKMETPWDLDRCKKVLDVHDEVQMESEKNYAKECGEVYCQSITLAGQLLGFNVLMEGDYNVGPNWADTH